MAKIIIEPEKKRIEICRLFMQIMECCYYLNNMNVSKTKGEPKKKEDDSNFVRLLTGSRALCNVTEAETNGTAEKTSKQASFTVAAVKKSTGEFIGRFGSETFA